MTLMEKLEKLGACCAATDWVAAQKSKRRADMWAKCQRSDWMWWALCRAKRKPTKRQSVAFARWCAKRAKQHTAARAASHAATYAADAARAASHAAYAAYCDAYAAHDAAAEFLAQADYLRKHFTYPELP